MGESEKALLHTYVGGNKILLITGEDATGIGNAANVIRFSRCPGKDYSQVLQKDLDATTPDREQKFLGSLKSDPAVRVVGSAMLATSIARVDGKPHVFLANFTGLRGGANPVQTPQTGVEVTIAGATKGRGFFLPFLGDVQRLDGTVAAGSVTYHLPAIEKGAVFWHEP
jgi:hypothetical protein